LLITLLFCAFSEVHAKEGKKRNLRVPNLLLAYGQKWVMNLALCVHHAKGEGWKKLRIPLFLLGLGRNIWITIPG
jgi:hypothetical protein